MKKCVFLDRDGTINKYKELLHKKEELELEETVPEAIKLINKNEYLCIVLTNQPVIARNLCTLDDVLEINEELKRMLAEKNNAYLDDIFICPHHPDSGYTEENKEYKVECECRKPKIGMIKEAQRKYDIDLSKSYLIGDTTIDMQTGKNAGLRTILLNTGLKGEDNKFNVRPDLFADNLISAVELILKEGK